MAFIMNRRTKPRRWEHAGHAPASSRLRDTRGVRLDGFSDADRIGVVHAVGLAGKDEELAAGEQSLHRLGGFLRHGRVEAAADDERWRGDAWQLVFDVVAEH